MIEQIVKFGKDYELSGIICNPDNKASDSSLLLFNAGMIHRVGFNRFNTDIARLLVKDGYASMRFDLHNIGDSANYNGNIPYDNKALEDISDAIDCLINNSKTRNCIIIGLCSAADYAHNIAVNDSRVQGIVFLDGYAYPTIGFYIRDFVPRLFNPTKIIKSRFNGLIRSFSKYSLTSNYVSKLQIYVRKFPSKQKVENELQLLIDRGVKLCFIYSGGVPVYYNHKNQFRNMFRAVRFKGNVEHHYIKEADHTYTLIRLRQNMMQIIREWVNKTFCNRPVLETVKD